MNETRENYLTMLGERCVRKVEETAKYEDLTEWCKTTVVLSDRIVATIWFDSYNTFEIKDMDEYPNVARYLLDYLENNADPYGVYLEYKRESMWIRETEDSLWFQ